MLLSLSRLSTDLLPASFLPYPDPVMFVRTSSLRRFRFLLAIMLTGGLCLPALAQSDDPGSVYSRFGLGALQSAPSSQIQALGGGGAALWSLNYANFDNPATLGGQVLTRVAAGAHFQRVYARDAFDNSGTLTNGSLNAVQFSFPLLTNRLGVGLGFQPYSRVNYRVQTEGQLILDSAAPDTALYRINNEGRGGLQKITAGLGYRISNAVSVGGSLDVVFGILEEGRRTIFLTTGFEETNLVTSTRLRGVTGTLGALITLPNVLRAEDDVSIGVSVGLPTGLDGNRVLTLGESLDRDTLGAEISGDVELPLSVRGGVAYHTDSRWTAVLDARYEPWSAFSSDVSWPGFDPAGENRFQDRFRLSTGVEVIPAGSDFTAPYFSRAAYRLGLYYDRAYVMPVPDRDLRTVALTGGVSLPTLLPGTHLDLNVEVGTRGVADDNLVRDRFYSLSATLNFGERWFLKRKLR